jgi:hypothetical protein
MKLDLKGSQTATTFSRLDQHVNCATIIHKLGTISSPLSGGGSDRPLPLVLGASSSESSSKTLWPQALVRRYVVLLVDWVQLAIQDVRRPQLLLVMVWAASCPCNVAPTHLNAE